jgi:hypothetical protein
VRILVGSQASTLSSENEDWVSASPALIVVLDGATARTETGCRHGISWYAAQLGSALSAEANSPIVSLAEALAVGIRRVADLHPECDLSHEGTPSAAVGMVRFGEAIEYLVLGDVSVILDADGVISAISDERVSQTALTERSAADKFPIGSLEKNDALVRMKHAELAMRNRPGGYWIAAADPIAAEYALTGSVLPSSLRRIAVTTDGAARVVDLFDEMTWADLLDTAGGFGVDAVLRKVRMIEQSDPSGVRWPRNKRSDDATIAYAEI